MSKRVLFVSLPSHLGVLPYAYLSLASYINANSEHKVFIFWPKKSMDLEEYLSQLINYILELSPNVIGIACYTPDYNYVIKLAEIIKKRVGCRIVVGNVHATLFPSDFIYKGSPVDFAVIGEGEITLKHLLNVLDKGGDLSSIEGLAFLRNTECYVTLPRRFCDLSRLPPINYSLIDVESYLNCILMRHVAARGLPISTSRGCPYKCKFCAANTVWNSNIGSKIRFREVKSIIEEVLSLKEKYSIFGFAITDDTFTARRDRVLEFCDKITPLKMIWGAQARVNDIDEELVKSMKVAGCIQLEFGVESGSESVLKRINKQIDTEDVIRASDICHSLNMRLLVNVMFNHPDETIEDVAETVALLDRIHPDECMVHELTPYPGTAIFEEYGFDRIITKANYYFLAASAISS